MNPFLPSLLQHHPRHSFYTPIAFIHCLKETDSKFFYSLTTILFHLITVMVQDTHWEVSYPLTEMQSVYSFTAPADWAMFDLRNSNNSTLDYKLNGIIS